MLERGKVWGRFLLALAYVILIAGALTEVFPFYWMFVTSLKKGVAAIRYPPELIAKEPTLYNYISVWQETRFPTFFRNSSIAAISTTILVLLLASLAAYSFARMRFRGRDAIFAVILSTMMLPGVVTVIPNFILLKNLGLINSLPGLIVPYTIGGLPMSIFILQGYFKSIPSELDEAAIIDGCSRFGVYWRIILPVSRPALATVAIFTFLGTWGEFFWALISAQSEEMYTLPVGLVLFMSRYHISWGYLTAGMMIAVLPVIIFFLLLQRQFIAGLTAGAVKG